MSEQYGTSASADRLQSTAADLSRRGEELAEASRGFRARIEAAIEVLPRHAETVKSATRKFLAGIRGAPRTAD
jgi:hypothetical protein